MLLVYLYTCKNLWKETHNKKICHKVSFHSKKKELKLYVDDKNDQIKIRVAI